MCSLLRLAKRRRPPVEERDQAALARLSALAVTASIAITTTIASIAGCGGGTPGLTPGSVDAGRRGTEPLSDSRAQPRRDGLVAFGPDSAAYWQPEAPGAVDASADRAVAARPTDAGVIVDAGTTPRPTESCSGSPPVGAPRAPSARRYSRGTCPTWRAGSNAMATGPDTQTATRRFLLVLPAEPARPGERFPLAFAWHWLGGSAAAMVERGRLQQTADQYRMVFIVPEAKGDVTIFGSGIGLFGFATVPWPFMATTENRRVEEELVFFDDLLSCATAQLPINQDCVSTIGLSAGALFSAQLAAARGDYLASLVSLSGGVQSAKPLGNLLLLRPWSNAGASATHRLPALVLWGGGGDECLTIDFASASRALESVLVANGHFLVECVHDCSHGLWFDDGLPPAAGEPLPFASLVAFMLAHPYWLAPGASPYRLSGLPASFLPFCGVGAGHAVQRYGICPPSKCNLL